MKQNNNEQIVFDMFEEVATESIAEARNAYTYEEIDECYQEAKEIADKARKNLLEKTEVYKKINPTEAGL
jgi:hypothetical protein